MVLETSNKIVTVMEGSRWLSPSLCGCRDRLEALTKRPKRSSGIALAASITTGSYIIVWGREPRDKTRMR